MKNKVALGGRLTRAIRTRRVVRAARVFLLCLLLLAPAARPAHARQQGQRRRDPPVVSGVGPQTLPRSSPERQGVSSSAILTFVEAADRDVDQMHSFMLVRHGYVVAEGWW